MKGEHAPDCSAGRRCRTARGWVRSVGIGGRAHSDDPVFIAVKGLLPPIAMLRDVMRVVMNDDMGKARHKMMG